MSMCRVISCVIGGGCLLWAVHSLGKTVLAFALLYFVLQGQNIYSWNTGVDSLSLLQGIFPTQGLNPGLPHCKQILYQLSHKGSPRILEWVAFPFSCRSPLPRNQTRVSCIAGGFFANWAISEALYVSFSATPSLISLGIRKRFFSLYYSTCFSELPFHFNSSVTGLSSYKAEKNSHPTQG